MDDHHYMWLSNIPQQKPGSTIKKYGILSTKYKPNQQQSPLKSQKKLFNDSDTSLLTDDEDEKENKQFGVEENENQNKDVLSQTETEPNTELNTQCSNVELKMSKLEITESNALTDDDKISPPLFSTESNSCRLSNVQKEIPAVKVILEDSQDTILTISSSDGGTQTELNTEIDENEGIPEDQSENNQLSESLEPPLKSSDPNCSAPYQPVKNSSISDSAMRRLSDFFGKIPPVLDDLTEIDFSNTTIPESPDVTIISDEESIENSQPDIEINRPIPPKTASPQITVTSVTKKNKKTINISAKIKVDIVLTAEGFSSSSSSDDDDDSPKESPALEAPDSDKYSTPSDKYKQATPKRRSKDQEKPKAKENITPKPKKDQSNSAKSNNQSKERPKTKTDSKPRQKEKDLPADEIDLDDNSIAILNDIYGSAWRTPDLLNKITKKQSNSRETFEPNMTDFQKFNANVRRNLESTRVEDRRSGTQTPAVKSPVVKSPFFKDKPAARRTPLKETPKYRKILQIVDSDTSDSEEEEEVVSLSDDSYKVSESDQSSSESSSSGKSRASTKRDKKGARKKKRDSREKFDFTQNASSDSELEDTIFIDVDKIPGDELKKKKKEGKKDGKRKLFTETSYDTPDTGEEEEDKKKEEKKKDLNREISFPWLNFTPVNKKLEAVKGTVPRFSKCGFLTSLDPTISKNLADPEAFVFRESYKSKKTELAMKLYDIYNKSVFDNQLDVPIKWNKKLLTTAGRCINMGKIGVRKAEIELSDKVLTSADRLRCTLIHELCHAAAWIVNAEKKGHAGHWRMWTDKAGKALPELPKITVCHQYNIEYKYTYQCTTCPAKTQMHSKAKKTENIRCKYCHGEIEILLNKKNKAGDVLKTPVRAASGFALFVKENYKKFKQPDLKHADVMKLLGQDFAKLKVQKPTTELD